MLMQSSDYVTTLQGLEYGLQVRHIATFDPITCHVDDDASTVFAGEQTVGIDQLPVTDGQHIVGVVERACIRPGTVERCLTTLGVQALVTANMPLEHFIDILDILPTRRYWLVLDGAEVRAIVTRSDVLKLPVRLLTFALVTHLELLMAAIIEERTDSDEEWLAMLSSDKRREKVRCKQIKLRRQDMDPPLVQLAEFCDKRDAVRTILGLDGSFSTDLRRIEGKLRNVVAHAGDYATNDQELRQFVDLVHCTRPWIHDLDTHRVQTSSQT